MDITSIFIIRDVIRFKEWVEDRIYGKHNELRKLSRRVLKVLTIHDIPVSRIPWVFPEFNFKLESFTDVNSVISIINDDFLNCLSEKFFIDRYWLDTGNGSPQTQYVHGYDFNNVFDYLTNLKTKDNEYIGVYFLAENGTKFIPVEDHGTHHGLMIVVAITTQSDEKESFNYTRYLPLYVGYWHYYKTRMMIKSIALLCFQLGFIQKGSFSKFANFRGMDNLFMTEIFKSEESDSWYPDDFIFTSEKSECSIDREDAGRMHNYLKKIGYFEKIKNLKSCEWLEQ